MQLSESKLFTIEALNRIEGFVWPEKAGFAAMDAKDGCVSFYKIKPHHEECYFTTINGYLGFEETKKPHPDWRNSLITKEEFDSVDGWVRHDNSECPTNSESLVQVKMDGVQAGYSAHISKAWAWVNGGITHWRYHKPTKESAMTTTKQEVKPEIHAIYENYKQQRETTADAQRALDASKEAEDALLEQIKQWNLQYGFDVRLLDESEENQEQQDSELVITDWRDLRVGDVVEVVMVNNRGGTDGYDGIVGKQCRVILTEDPDYPQQAVQVDFEGHEVFIHKWKFIRRPQ